MEVALHLDPQLKKVVEELFLTSAQAPSLGIEGSSLAQDGFAIFRIAKEFSLNQPTDEVRKVDAEDVARMLRFVGWLLNYGGDTPLSATSEKQVRLRQFLASVILQAQAQFSGFEVLLRSFGVDRQLDPQLMTSKKSRLSSRREREATTDRDRSATEAHASEFNLSRTDRTHHVQVKVSAEGAEMSSMTTESIWAANGNQRSSRSKS